ncbi:MAG: hypothetical protein Kow0063_25080 [Anaerolineae bacterium]
MTIVSIGGEVNLKQVVLTRNLRAVTLVFTKRGFGSTDQIGVHFVTETCQKVHFNPRDSLGDELAELWNCGQ